VISFRKVKITKANKSNNMDYDLKFLRYTNPVVAGSRAELVMSLSPPSVGTELVSEAIDVHAGFQGSYSWGDLPYTEHIERVKFHETPLPEVGGIEVSAGLDVPFKTLIEFDCEHFSYYAYVTPEGGRLTPEAQVIISEPVDVRAPETVTREELNALLTQLRWLVENSALSKKVKQGLAAAVEVQIETLDKLDDPINRRVLRESLDSFSKELESGRARRYHDAKLWARQMRFIVSRLQKLQATRILEKVPIDKAFRFYAGIGSYTGVDAESLVDFLEKLATIDIRALEFHLPRKDFENWIIAVLGDAELAGRLARIREKGLPGEDLRRTVLNILNERYAELQRISSET